MGESGVTLDSLIEEVMDRIHETRFTPEESLVLASVLEKLEGIRTQREYLEMSRRNVNNGNRN